MFSTLFVELTNIYVHIATNNLKRIYMKSLLIIGAGPGGYECALRAAKSGLDVHVVDRAEHIGGACRNGGCSPT